MYLFASLVLLPFSYLFLHTWMKGKVRNPPTKQFFCIFGVIGGTLLLMALSPSFLTLLAFLPFVVAALVAVVWSLITSLQAKPRTKFHKASAAICGLLIPLIFWCAVSGGWDSINYAGQWDDDSGNWSRAMGGEPLPSGVQVLHSRFRRSAHFTYEASYFFEITAPEKFLNDWIAFQKLSATSTSDNIPLYYGKPSWFLPKPLADYDMWVPEDCNYDYFRIYRDRASGTLYVSDSQGGG